MSSRYFVGFFLFFGFIFSALFYAPHAFAASIIMQNAPSQIGVTDEYAVDTTLAISVADGTNYYLRGVFYKTGTSGSYCGYTWNGNDWFKGPFSNSGDQKQFLKITITNHGWTGQIKAKIDASDSVCATSGNYSFKIERFTETSSTGTFDDQTEQALTVVIPTPTPTNVPTSSPTKISLPPTPTTTPKSLTPTPTSKIPIPTPTSRPANTPTSSIIALSHSSVSTILPALTNGESSFGAVLGSNASIAPKEENKPTLVAAEGNHKEIVANWFPVLFILIGFGLLASCGILIAARTEKGKMLWKKFF